MRVDAAIPAFWAAVADVREGRCGVSSCLVPVGAVRRRLCRCLDAAQERGGSLAHVGRNAAQPHHSKVAAVASLFCAAGMEATWIARHRGIDAELANLSPAERARVLSASAAAAGGSPPRFFRRVRALEAQLGIDAAGTAPRGLERDPEEEAAGGAGASGAAAAPAAGGSPPRFVRPVRALEVELGIEAAGTATVDLERVIRERLMLRRGTGGARDKVGGCKIGTENSPAHLSGDLVALASAVAEEHGPRWHMHVKQLPADWRTDGSTSKKRKLRTKQLELRRAFS